MCCILFAEKNGVPVVYPRTARVSQNFTPKICTARTTLALKFKELRGDDDLQLCGAYLVLQPDSLVIISPILIASQVMSLRFCILLQAKQNLSLQESHVISL